MFLTGLVALLYSRHTQHMIRQEILEALEGMREGQVPGDKPLSQMRLSTRSMYGMRALVELALIAGGGPLSAAFIARRQELSVAYLEQLLHRLKKEHLVKSIRGPKGGYVLSKSPGQITMAEVVRMLDGGNGAPFSRGSEGHGWGASGPSICVSYLKGCTQFAIDGTRGLSGLWL